ncbi:MAG: AlpA family phage regulatory protein [Rhizobacter sp.]
MTDPAKIGSRPRAPRAVAPLSAVEGDGLLQREVVLAYCGISDATLYEMMRTRGFPASVKLSPRCVRWHAPAVRAWVAKQVEEAAA